MAKRKQNMLYMWLYLKARLQHMSSQRWLLPEQRDSICNLSWVNLINCKWRGLFSSSAKTVTRTQYLQWFSLFSLCKAPPTCHSIFECQSAGDMTWGFLFAVSAWSPHRQRFSALRTLDLWKNKLVQLLLVTVDLYPVPKIWRLHNPPIGIPHSCNYCSMPCFLILAESPASHLPARASGLHLEGSGYGCWALKNSSWNLRIHTGLLSAGDSGGS